MANSNFNYLKKDVVNWLPLSTLNRNNERWENGTHYNSSEATSNFGGGSTETYGTKIMYAFGLGAPAGSRPLYYTTEDYDNLNSETDAIVLNNWGRHDMLGVKRAFSGVEDPNSELDTQPLDNESGIFINTKYAIKVWLFYGNTFFDGVTSTSEGDTGVGYWAEYTNIPAGESATIPWIRDQYGFQSERMYFEYDLTVDTESSLNVKTNTELLEIEDVAQAKGLTSSQIAAGLTGSDVYGLMVVPAFGPILVDGTPGDASLDQDVLIIETGDDEFDTTFGPMSSDYIDSMDISSLLIENEEGEVINTIQVNGQVGTSYLLLGNPAKSKIHMTNTYDSEADQTTFSFSMPAHDEGDSLMLYFNVNVEGILSGFVEGSAISGATVEGFAADGTKQTTTTDANGAYNFEEAVHGVIVATGGVNSLTNEAFEGELKTNSNIGAVLSNITTEINDIMEEDGSSLEEALETMVDPNVKAMSGMDASITKEDLREYAKKGMAGLQKEGKAITKIAKIAAANKSIEEETKLGLTAFETEGLTAKQKRKVRKSIKKAQRKAKRAMRKGNIEAYKSRLQEKLGDAEINSMNTDKLDMAQIRFAAMLEAVEDVQQEGVEVRGDVETRKQTLKTAVEAKESKVEIEVIEGATFESMVLELNAEAEKRNSATMKMVKAIEDEEEEISFDVEAETFAIQKTATGYQTSGSVKREVTKEIENVELTIEDNFMDDARIVELEVKTQKGKVIITGEREIHEDEIELLPYRMKASNYIVFSENVEEFVEQYTIQTSWSIRQAAINADGEKFEVHFQIYDIENRRNIHLDHEAWNEGSQFRGVIDTLLKLGELFEEVRESRVYHEMYELNQYINEDSSAVDAAIAEFKKNQVEINNANAEIIEKLAQSTEDSLAGQAKKVKAGNQLYVYPTLFSLIENTSLLSSLNEDLSNFEENLTQTQIFRIVDFAANMQTYAGMRGEEDLGTLEAQLKEAVQEGDDAAAAVFEYRINEMQNRIDAFQTLSNVISISTPEIAFPEMNDVEQVDDYLNLLENAHESATQDRDGIKAINEKHGFNVDSFDGVLEKTLSQIEERTNEANKLKATLSGDAEVTEWEANHAENIKQAQFNINELLDSIEEKKAGEEKEVATFNRLFVGDRLLEKLHSEFGGEQLEEFISMFGMDENFGNDNISAWSHFKYSIFSRGEQLDAYIGKTKADEEMHEKVKELELNKLENLKEFVNIVVGKYEGILPENNINIDFKAASAKDLEHIFKMAGSLITEREDAQKEVSELRDKFAEQINTNEIVDRAKDFVSEAKSFEKEIGSLILETENAEYEKAREAFDILKKDAVAESNSIAENQDTLASLTDEAVDLKSEVESINAEHNKEMKKLEAELETANNAGDEALVEKLNAQMDELEQKHDDNMSSLEEKSDKIEQERADKTQELDEQIRDYEENFAAQVKELESTLINEASDVEQYNQYITAGNLEEYLQAALQFDRIDLIEAAIQNIGTPDYKEKITEENKSNFEEAIRSAIKQIKEEGKSSVVFRYGGGYNGNAATENGSGAYQEYLPSKYVEFQRHIEGVIPTNTDWGMSQYGHVLRTLIEIYQSEEAYRNHLDDLAQEVFDFKQTEDEYLKAIHRAQVRPRVDSINDVNEMDSYIDSLEVLISEVTEKLSGEEKEFALNNYGKALEKAENVIQDFWNNFEVISMYNRNQLEDELARINDSRHETEERMRLEYETEDEFFAKLEVADNTINDHWNIVNDWAPLATVVEDEFKTNIAQWNDYWKTIQEKYAKDMDKLEMEFESENKSIDKINADKKETESAATQQADEFEAKSAEMQKSHDAQIKELGSKADGASEEDAAAIKSKIAELIKSYENEVTEFENYKKENEAEKESQLAQIEKDLMQIEDNLNDIQDRMSDSKDKMSETEETLKKFTEWSNGSKFLDEPMQLWEQYHNEAGMAYDALTAQLFETVEESFSEIMRNDVESLSNVTDSINKTEAKRDSESATYDKLRADMKASIVEVDTRHAEDVASLTANHEKEMSELKSKMEGASGEDAAEMEAEMASMEKDYTAKTQEMDDKNKAAHQEYKKSLSDAYNANDERQASFEKELSDLVDLKSKFEEEIATYDTDKEEALKDLIDNYKHNSENYLKSRDQWASRYLDYYSNTFERISDEPSQLRYIMGHISSNIGNMFHIELGSDFEGAQRLNSQISDFKGRELSEKEAEKLKALQSELENMIQNINENKDSQKYEAQSHGIARLFTIGGGYAGSQNKFGAGEIEASEYPVREWNKVISILFDNAQINIGKVITSIRSEGGQYTFHSGTEALVLGLDMVGGRDQAQSSTDEMNRELEQYAEKLYYKDDYRCKETEQIEEMDRDLEDAITIVSQLKENIANAEEELANIENGGSGDYGTTEQNKNEFEFYLKGIEKYKSRISDCYDDSISSPQYSELEDMSDHMERMSEELGREFNDMMSNVREKIQTATDQLADAENNLADAIEMGDDKQIKAAETEVANYSEILDKLKIDSKENVISKYNELQDTRGELASDLKHQLRDVRENIKTYVAEEEANFKANEEEFAKEFDMNNKLLEKLAGARTEAEDSMKADQEKYDTEVAENDKSYIQQQDEFKDKSEKMSDENNETVAKYEKQIEEAEAPEMVAELEAELAEIIKQYKAEVADFDKYKQEEADNFKASKAEAEKSLQERQDKHEDEMANYEKSIEEAHDKASQIKEDLSNVAEQKDELTKFLTQSNEMFIQTWEQLHDRVTQFVGMARAEAGEYLDDDVRSIKSFSKTLDKIESEISSLEKDRDNLEKTTTKAEEDLSKVQEDLSKSKEDLSNIESDLDSINTDIKDLESQITETEDKKNSEEAEHSKSKEDADVEYKTKTEEAKQKHEDTLAEMDKSHKSESEEEAVKFKSDLAETEKSHQSKTEEAEAKHKDALTKTEETYAKETKESEAAYQDSKTTLSTKIDEDTAKFKSELEEEQANLEAAPEEEKAGIQAKIDDMTAEYEDSKSTDETTLDAMSVEHDTKKAETEQKHKDNVTDMVSTYEAGKAEAEKKHKANVSDMESTYEASKAEAEKKHKTKREDVENKHAEEMKTAETEHAQNSKEAADEFESKQAEHTDQIKKYKEESSSKEAESDKLMEAEASLNNNISDNEESMSNITEELKSLKESKDKTEDQLTSAEDAKSQNESDYEKLKEDVENTAQNLEDAFRQLHDEYRQIRSDFKDEWKEENKSEFESKTDDIEGAMTLIEFMEKGADVYLLQSLINLIDEKALTDFENLKNNIQDRQSDTQQNWDKADSELHSIKQLFEIGGGYAGSQNGFGVGTSIEEWQNLSHWSFALYRNLDAIIQSKVDSLFKEESGNFVFDAYQVLALKTDLNPGSEDLRAIESALSDLSATLEQYKTNVYYFDSYNNEGIEGLPKLDDVIEYNESEFETLEAKYRDEEAKKDDDGKK